MQTVAEEAKANPFLEVRSRASGGGRIVYLAISKKYKVDDMDCTAKEEEKGRSKALSKPARSGASDLLDDFLRDVRARLDLDEPQGRGPLL